MKNTLKNVACFTCFTVSLLMITSCSNRVNNMLVTNSMVEDSCIALNRETMETIFHPIVVGDVLLGGSCGSKWFCAYEIAQELTGEEIYRLYGLNVYMGETKGAKVVPETDQWSGPYTEFVDLDYDFAV